MGHVELEPLLGLELFHALDLTQVGQDLVDAVTEHRCRVQWLGVPDDAVIVAIHLADVLLGELVSNVVGSAHDRIVPSMARLLLCDRSFMYLRS